MMRVLFLGMSVEFLEISGFGIGRICKIITGKAYLRQVSKVVCGITDICKRRLSILHDVFELNAAGAKKKNMVLG